MVTRRKSKPIFARFRHVTREMEDESQTRRCVLLAYLNTGHNVLTP